MTRTLAAAALLVSPVFLCGAAPASLEAAFGNTILSTYPDGRTAELWLQPSGEYTAEGRRGDRSGGHWKVSNGKLCLRQSRPFPAPFSYCTQIPSGDFRKAWRAKAVTGEELRVRLVRGRSLETPPS